MNLPGSLRSVFFLSRSFSLSSTWLWPSQVLWTSDLYMAAKAVHASVCLTIHEEVGHTGEGKGSNVGPPTWANSLQEWGHFFCGGNGRFPPKDFLFVVGKLTSPSLSPLGLSVVRAECHLLVDWVSAPFPLLFFRKLWLTHRLGDTWLRH